MKIIKRILEVLWVLLFAYLGYASYDVGGETALFYFIVIMWLTSPSSLVLLLIMQMAQDIFGPHPINTHTYIAQFLFIFGFMLLGFVQWFILLPWLVKRIKTYVSRKSPKYSRRRIQTPHS